MGNCFRCGTEFTRDGLERLCNSCRKPRVTPIRRERSQALTLRERQVLDRLSMGMQNKEIAHHLNLGEPTIKQYMVAIFRKLGKTNRVEAAVWWVEQKKAA
jgi:DNA-binding NarL/FixJ family response regulator